MAANCNYNAFFERSTLFKHLKLSTDGQSSNQQSIINFDNNFVKIC